MNSDNLLKSQYLVIISNLDEAGMNMRKRMFEILKPSQIHFSKPQKWPDGNFEIHQYGNTLFLTLPHKQIHVDYLIEFIDCELVIFASKHFSSSAQKALLVHTTGVWGIDQGFGGQDHELAFAPSYALFEGYKIIQKLVKKNSLSDYWVGLEATHHGPTSFKQPVLFAECGGTSEEWNDYQACSIIGDMIVHLIKLPEKRIDELNELTAFIGFGGGHYCPNFIKAMNSDNVMPGHIAPKYASEFYTSEMITQAWKKTLGIHKIILIDKKGVNSETRKKLIELIDKLDFPWKFT